MVGPTHAEPFALRAYATQKTATAMSPSRVPQAAWAAKAGSCSAARNTDTGPDVKGSPATQPPTPGPQRRATSVATAMRSDVEIAFRIRTVMWQFHYSPG